MDLRVQRTRKNIIDAFVALRSKKELDKITVTELAKAAMINKATFYRYYQDIYDLSEQLEEEVIGIAIDSIPHPEYFLTRPKEGVCSIAQALLNQSELYNIVFSGKRREVLAVRLEDALKRKVYEIFPEYRDDLKMDIILTAMIRGTFSTFLDHADDDFETVIGILGEMTELVLKPAAASADVS